MSISKSYMFVSPVVFYIIMGFITGCVCSILLLSYAYEDINKNYDLNIKKIADLERDLSNQAEELKTVKASSSKIIDRKRFIESELSRLQMEFDVQASENAEIKSINDNLQEQNSIFRRKLNVNRSKFYKFKSSNINSCSKISVGKLCLNQSHKYGVFECNNEKFEITCDKSIANFTPLKKAAILQYILKRNGYSVGKIDRDAGKKTSKALSSFLSDNYKIGRKYDKYIRPNRKVDIQNDNFVLLIDDMISLYNVLLR